MKYVLKIAGVILSTLFLILNANAQESTETPIPITVFRDVDTLTLYIADPAEVSLTGFAYAVSDDIHPLESFSAFRGLPFTRVPTPICFRLIRSGANSPLPQDCTSALILTQMLSNADVFWYDSVLGQDFVILIQRDNITQGICPSGQAQCEITFTPQSVAPTPTPVATLPLTTQPTPQFLSTIDNVEYTLTETRFEGGKLQIWFIGSNSGADKEICLYFTSYLIDEDGVQHRQSGRSDGNSTGGSDCFWITLPYQVPTRFGLIFDDVIPSTTSIPFIQVAIRSEDDIQFRDMPVPYLKEISPTPKLPIEDLITLEDVTYRLTEASFSSGKLSIWFLAENEAADKDICLYFTSFLIDEDGSKHRQSARSNGNSTGGLDCFGITLPTGIPTRFGLIFEDVPPDAVSIPLVEVVIQGEGSAQFRNIPLPYDP